MITLNPQRLAYLEARGKVVLNACPGSGKTTTVAYKLHKLVEDEIKDSVGCGIACLSFTNVAKEEIQQKYLKFSGKTLGHPNLVSTIDSFINSYITLPFYYLATTRKERPHILEENNDLDNFNIAGLWDFKAKKYKHLNKAGQALVFIYKPSTIVRDIDGKLTSNGNLPDAAKVDLAIFNDYAGTVKKWQLEQGILTHSDSTYLALQILTKYTHVAAALAKRFSTIIIDEAQDTSEIQHAIFDKLLTGGLVNLELIGDPYQSLYMWRNAKPVVFINKFNNAEWMGLNLSNNWRSTQTIINAYSLLRNSTDEAIVAENTFTNEAAIHIIRFDEGNEADAVDKYKELCKKFKSNQVVTRSIELSQKISGLSNADANYWKNMLGAKITQSVLDFKNNKIKTAIDSLRWVAINILAPSLDYKQKKITLMELRNDYDLNSQLSKLLHEFSNLDISLEDWTKNVQKRLKEEFELTIQIDLQLKKGKFSPFHKKKMAELFSGQMSKWSFPISTIHKVKGMTLDSILLFLHKNGHSISVVDIEPSNGQLTEYQTMIYVAMSRPKHLLAIAIENSVNNDDIIRRLGDKVIFI